MHDNQGFSPREEARNIYFKTPTFIDPLTGLFNQYYLFRFLPEEMQKAKLGNYPLTIFMVDLDNFKAVNDNYGHLSGDEVLKQLAAILKKFVRQTDVVIRYAGDEFTVLLPAADQDKARMLANRLITEVSNYTFKGKDGQDMRLTMSIGFAVYPRDAEQVNKLIDMADKALYMSKQKGKNRVSESKEVTLEATSYMIAMDSFPCPVFIDRKEEIDRLRHIFDIIVAKSNLLHTAFISGGAGVGKSRLLNELNNFVHDRAAIIHCHSSSMHMQDPYYLFTGGISAYIDKVGIDNPQHYNLFSRMPAGEVAEMSRVIPSVAHFIKGPVELGPQGKNTRFLLFKSLLDFLIELEKSTAVVISFDDIHWADKASLELLRYLIKQEINKRIFITCSFSESQDKEISRDNAFEDLWDDIHYNTNFTDIELLNFSLADTSFMIESIFSGIVTNKEFYELIYRATKGNSSFVEEILKLLVENAVIFYQDNRWHVKKDFSSQDVPLSIEEVIKKRLKKLDKETKDMIVEAAVIGDDFSLDTLKKIENKDEGFMLELLKRAKKMRLVDESEQKGKFGFINKNVQDLLYRELNEAELDLLHYKIGKAIAEEYKDNVYNAAGGVAFHFGKAPKQEKALEYSAEFLEKAAQVFSPDEIMEYLEKLAMEIVSEEKKAPPALALSEKTLKEALRLINSLHGAVKNFQLYPPGTIRTSVINETYAVINAIWVEAERLTFSEIEKSLVINGKRLLPKEIEHSNAGNFLSIMMEHNIKTISFFKDLPRDGLEKLIQYLSRSYAEIINKGGWRELIEKEGIRGIKIDEVNFVQLSQATKEFEEKKEVEDIMLMEFLLDKVEHGHIDTKAVIHTMKSEPKRFAQTIMNAAQEIVKNGKADTEEKAVANIIEKISAEVLEKDQGSYNDYTKYVARVAMELKPALRSKVIRSQLIGKESRQRQIDNVLEMTSDEVIVDMIIEEYKESQGNLLALKEYIDKVLTNEFRKKEVLLKLETELSKLNMADEDIAFVIGQLKWEDLPLDKRLSQIMRLPDKYYASQLKRIRAFLEELDTSQNRQVLENIIYYLLVKSGQLEPNVGRELMKIITDFIKAPFLNDLEKSDVQGIEGRLGGVLKRLNIEADPKVFSAILDIFGEAIKEFTLKLRSARNITLELEKPAVKRKYVFIQQLLSVLSQRFKWEESRDLGVCSIIEDFILDIYNVGFLEILIYGIVNAPLQKELNLNDIFSIVKDKFVDILINLTTQKAVGWGDSFREYIMRKGIAGLLREQDESILNIFRKRSALLKENMPLPLIEMIGYLKRQDCIELLIPLFYHKDPLMRRAAILALGDIGTEKGIEIISRILKEEKDRNILALTKDLLKKLKAER